MTRSELQAKIENAQRDKRDHELLGEWGQAETKSCLIIRLEQLLSRMSDGRYLPTEKVGGE